MKALSLLSILLWVSLPAVSAILIPGEYTGVVIFDRWGACHLFTGVQNLEISEAVKEALRPYRGKAVVINAQEIHQPMNPGTGLVTKLTVLGPAQVTLPSSMGPLPDVEGLSIHLVHSLPEEGRNEFLIELRDTGNFTRKVDTRALGPLLLTKKGGFPCWNPADGPSYAIISHWTVALLHDGPRRNTCRTSGKGINVQVSLPPDFALSARFELEPGRSVEIPLQIEASEGEYQLLVGNGGSFRAASIASNAVEFDVDATGRVHLAKSLLSQNQLGPRRRVGPVCGSVTFDDGRAATGARVYLWPLPLATEDARVAHLATTSAEGLFRMEGVRQGQYVLSAARFDSSGLTAGVFEGSVLANATRLMMPDSSTNCALRLAIHPQPTYLVRGRTSAGPGRVTKMTLKSGNAFPFESTAVVQSDGRYEHRVPAGRYQFFAGNTGAGFRVDSDIDHLDVPISWPQPASSARSENAMPPDFNEEMAINELREIAQAQVTYEKTYRRGFAKNLTVLGPPPTWHHPTADHAGLLSKLGTPFLTGEDSTHFTTAHYRFSYSVGEPDRDGHIRRYTVSARTTEFGKTGQRNFLLDESGVIHTTASDRPATRQDPVLDDRQE